MTEVEIIYIEPKVTEIYTSKSHVTIHPGEKKRLKEEKCTFNEKNRSSSRKRIVRVSALLMTAIVVLGTGGFVSYNAGFIPIKEFLEIQEPIGNAEEIDIDEYLRQYPEIKDIPSLDKVKYKVYGTDESTVNVANDYKQKLKENGYNVKYEGTIYKFGMALNYYVYLKGLTAVGIVTTSDAKGTFGHETMVLYTTGNILNYMEIAALYKLNQGLLESSLGEISILSGIT